MSDGCETLWRDYAAAEVSCRTEPLQEETEELRD